MATVLGAYGCGGTTVPDPVLTADAAARDAGPAADAAPAGDSGPAADAVVTEPDAEAPDATPVGDAAAPDAAGPDASTFTVNLTASTTTATTAAPIILAAVPLGLTATAVAFFDDGVRVGTSATPPFTLAVTYSAADSRVHALRAVAYAASGERAESDVVEIRVAIERGLYVDPASGDDTNPGTDALPLRSVRRATRLAVAGDSIFLKDGVYGASEPTPGCIAIPAGVSLRAVRAGGARFVAVGVGTSGCAFGFSGDALVDGLVFEGHEVALQFLSGTSMVHRVRIDGASTGFDLRGAASITLVDPVVTGFRASAFGVAVAVVDGTSQLTVQGGVFEGAGAGTGMFLVRGSATLVAEGTVFRNNGRNAVRVSDNAHLVLRDVTIENCGTVSPQPDQASISIGGLNTASVRTTGIRLERSRIIGAPGNAIGAVYYGNLPSLIELHLVDSEITDSGRRALFVNPLGQADPALVVDVAIHSSTIARNGGGGILAGLADLDIADSRFEGNAVAVGSTVKPSSLRVAGSTFVASELVVSPGPSTACELGTAAAPGDNVFTATGMGMATGLRLDAAVGCTAVGNTWLPAVQGADASGRYPATGSSVVGPISGPNYTLVAGATLER